MLGCQPGEDAVPRNSLTVGIAGLGAVGLNVARALEEGIPGLTLAAIAVRDRDKARRNLPGAGERIPIVAAEALAQTCDIVIECLPPQRSFPANVNVAAALSLAGIGPDKTRLEIWADPALSRNTHRIEVDADTARFSMAIEGIPSENPRTGSIVPLSVVAALRGLVAEIKVGT